VQGEEQVELVGPPFLEFAEQRRQFVGGGGRPVVEADGQQAGTAGPDGVQQIPVGGTAGEQGQQGRRPGVPRRVEAGRVGGQVGLEGDATGERRTGGRHPGHALRLGPADGHAAAQDEAVDAAGRVGRRPGRRFGPALADDLAEGLGQFAVGDQRPGAGRALPKGVVEQGTGGDQSRVGAGRAHHPREAAQDAVAGPCIGQQRGLGGDRGVHRGECGQCGGDRRRRAQRVQHGREQQDHLERVAQGLLP
jgi:hypothetical protein